MENKKGSVLMISLWILAILVVFALGLGHRAMINLRLAKYQRDRLKATYLAKAGINKAIVLINEDGEDDSTKDYDSLNDNLSNNKDSFSDILINDGKTEFATVSYDTFNENKEPKTIYGVRDEERWININIDTDSSGLLVALLMECEECGFNDTEANELANYIRIWRGDNDPTLNKDAVEYKDFKKAPFANPEELVIVLEYFYQKNRETGYQQKAQNIYKDVKDLITVYTPDNKININTVSLEVLTIIARNITDSQDASNLAQKITNFCKNKDIPFKDLNDTNAFESDQSLTDQEKGIFDEMKTNYLKVKSDYFRIESHGKVGNITKHIIAIYDRSGEGKIVYWHEN